MNTVATNSLGFSGSISEYFQLLLTIFFCLLCYFICFKFLKIEVSALSSQSINSVSWYVWYVLIGFMKNVSLGWIQISLESVSIYFVEPCNLTWLTILESSSVYKPFKRKLLHTSSFNLQGIWSTWWHSKDRTYLFNWWIDERSELPSIENAKRLHEWLKWRWLQHGWPSSLVSCDPSDTNDISDSPIWIDLRLSRLFCWFSSR